jgi:hypothetical protein
MVVMKKPFDKNLYSLYESLFLSINFTLNPRPLSGVMFIRYAIETLRDEAPLHATSTPGIKAVLVAGRRSRDSDCSKPHPFALNADQVKGPYGGQIKAPSFGRVCLLY